MSNLIAEREVAARQRKAFAIYARLSAIGVTADQAAHFDDAAWKGAAEAAQQRPPGKNGQTKRIVVEMLAASERERALCPWCSLGDPEGVTGPRQPAGHDGPCSR